MLKNLILVLLPISVSLIQSCDKKSTSTDDVETKAAIDEFGNITESMPEEPAVEPVAKSKPEEPENKTPIVPESTNDDLSVSGRVGALALDLASGGSTLIVVANAINGDGNVGAELANASITQDGSFAMKLPAQPGMIQLSVITSGLSLTDSSPVSRVRIPNLTINRSVAVNEVTELAVQRMKIRQESNDLDAETALKAALADAAAMTGVADVTVMPLDLNAASSDLNALKYGLYLKAWEHRREAMNVETSDFWETFLLDAKDGSLDGRKVGALLDIQGKPLVRTDYSNDIREWMKQVVSDSGDSVTLDFNAIPKTKGNFGSTIDFAISNETLNEFVPEEADPFDHWIRFETTGTLDLDFDHETTCIGPIFLRRTDSKGRSLNSGPALPVVVGAEYWTVHSDAACSGSEVISGSIPIPSNNAISESFYLKPERFTYNTIMGYVSTSDVPKVDYAFLSLLPHYNGKLIANTLIVEVYSNDSGQFRTWPVAGGSGAELSRNQCYPGAVSLGCGGSFCRQEGIFPANINVTMSVGNLGLTGTGTATLHADAACSTALGVTATITEGSEYVKFYLKPSSDLSRGFMSDWTLVWVNGNGLYGGSYKSGNIYVHKND